MLRILLLLCCVLPSCSFFPGVAGAGIATELVGLWEIRAYSDQTFADEELTEVLATGPSFLGFRLNFTSDAAADLRFNTGSVLTRAGEVESPFVWRVDARDGQAVLTLRRFFPCAEFEIERRAPVGGRDVFFLECVFRDENGDFRRIQMRIRA